VRPKRINPPIETVRGSDRRRAKKYEATTMTMLIPIHNGLDRAGRNIAEYILFILACILFILPGLAALFGALFLTIGVAIYFGGGFAAFSIALACFGFLMVFVAFYIAPHLQPRVGRAAFMLMNLS